MRHFAFSLAAARASPRVLLALLAVLVAGACNPFHLRVPHGGPLPLVPIVSAECTSPSWL